MLVARGRARGGGGGGAPGPEKLFIIEAKQMDKKVDDEGIVELEKETIFQYLSNLLGILLLQLFG